MNLSPGKIAQISIEITNKKDIFPWEGYGLRLFIPENSLPIGVEKCVLHLTVYSLCPYEIPPDHKLVSAVYSIDCNPEVDFKQELTLEIQHCTNTDELCFARAAGPFMSVDMLSNGDFKDKHYGSIQIRKFSLFSIVQKLLKNLQNLIYSDPNPEPTTADLCDYSAMLFYKVQYSKVVEIKITVCKDLAALTSVSLKVTASIVPYDLS